MPNPCIALSSFDTRQEGIYPLMKKIVLALTALCALVASTQAASLNIFSQGATWRFAKGTNEASTPITAWRSNEFNDVNFGDAPAPFWYGDVLPGGTQITDMMNSYLCIFLRKPFVLTNSNVSALTLGAAVDDGFVAWINGYEVLRVNPPPEPFTMNSSVAVAAAEPPPFNLYPLPAPSLYLNPSGTNVLTIQVFNAGLGSSDLGFDADLNATLDDVAPFLTGQAPAAGAALRELTAIQVNFSEDVTGINASDLLINGVPATNVLFGSPSVATFQFAQPAMTGTVSIAFAPGHGITDLYGNAFAGANWTYTLDPNLPVMSVTINEFMASNSGRGINGIRDEDGDGSDWIELYNSDTTVRNIGGWYLTDATNNLTKWRIPAGTTIGGKGYLIIFASGKNRTNIFGKLHTNFQLSNSGEYLALVDPNTNVVSDFYPVYPSQDTDVSYGRDQLDPTLVGKFQTPTPGGPNTGGTDPNLEVQFSRAGGSYFGSFQLALSTVDTNAQIRYALVNTANPTNAAIPVEIPTASSLLYTGPITIASSYQVRARAFPTNATRFPGPPHTECFIQVGAGLTNFTSDLPIVVLHTLNAANLAQGFPASDNQVIVAVFDNDVGGRASLMSKPQLIKRGAINLRGSSTQGFPKSSLAVELWDEYNQDEEASFAGLPKESDWVLYACNGFDKSLMHNPIMHQMGRDFGHYSSRTRFVEVFFRNGSGAVDGTTNGTGAAMGSYNGVYVLEEKVKRDGNRVDIEALNPEQTNYPAITGGYLLKIDRTDPNERTFVGGGVTINYQEPDGLEMVTPIRAPQANYIKSFLDFMNTGITGNALTNIASTNHYSNYIDVDKTIDLHIANVMCMNVDGYRLSGYLYKDRGQKLVMGPLWDTDRGLGTSDQGTSVNGDLRAFNPRAFQAWDPLGASDFGTDFFQGTTAPFWLGRWFADVDFWQRWVDRYQNFRATALDSNYVASYVDGFAAELRESQVREVKRWGGNGSSDTTPRTGTRTAGLSVYSHNFGATAAFQNEVDFQKRWLIDHINFIDTNLLNRPNLDIDEGQVPLGTILTLNDRSGKAGTVMFYTLDGTDPRGFQGTTNPAALRYNGPITITNNVRVRARAVNPNHRNLTGVSGPGSRNPVVSTPWSGDIAATYFITPPPLVISELMYHPAPPTLVTDTNDADNFEYVELQNVGTNTLNLVGFRFTNGIDFTFTATNNVTSLAPGGYVLIVKNFRSFTNRYGVKTNIAGVYNGELDNGGERITLVGPALEPILDFTYSDTWYPLSDGLGFALVIRDPNAPLNTWDQAESWRTGSFENGSPGVVDPPQNDVARILINEALTHTDPAPPYDTIELYNPTTNNVNIGGWYLTDDSNTPKKYQIPLDTMIPAGGYILFDETQFNVGPNGFALGSDGDELYLFSATNQTLTGWAHGYTFGAAQNGVTFGRYVNSQGVEHFVAQSANTLGATNALPLVGPIVISEILYHPPEALVGTNATDNSLDEFIELYNIANTNVPLYHLVNTTNTWRLSSAVDFSFPMGQSIAPSSSVLVVNFNPTTNLAQLAAFRSKYGVPTNIPLYGPYSGKLDNSSESVRLRRPDHPNLDGSVPYILVDQIDYQDGNGWPLNADGTGASIQRLVVQDFGNDPTNWAAARPTPSSLFIGGTPPVVTQQPTDTNTFANASATFRVAVSGTNVGVQWRFNGAAIPGATNLTLILTNVQYNQVGFYDAVAYNYGGTTVSSNAFLSVLIPLTFTLEPATTTVATNGTVTLTSAAFGTGPVHYQWLHEGTNVPNATNANFTITNASLEFGHGNWSVMVSDDYNTLTSSNAFVYLLLRPVFVYIPQSQTILAGQTVTFTAYATGAPPIYYRWLRAGAPVETNLSGVFSFSTNAPNAGPLTINVRVFATNYATGPSGQGTTPASGATLTVLPDADRDGISDLWETNYFGRINTTNNANNAAEDPDGDGMSNRDEYIAGTNPTNGLSLLKLFLTSTNKALEFVAQTNISYSVQYRTALGTQVWTTVSNVAAQPSLIRTVQVNTPNPPPERERYYRVVTPQVDSP